MQQCYAQKVMMYGRSNDFIWRQEYEVVHSSHLPPDDVPNKRRRSFGKPQSIFQRTFLSHRKEQNFPRACARSEVSCQMIGHVTGNCGYCGDHSGT